MADMNQYYVTLYAPIVAVDRSILKYGVGTILAIYGKPIMCHSSVEVNM